MVVCHGINQHVSVGIIEQPFLKNVTYEDKHFPEDYT